MYVSYNDNTHVMSDANARLGFVSYNRSLLRRSYRYRHYRRPCTQIATNQAPVNVSHANPPLAGQVLRATDASFAEWQTVSGGGGGGSGIYQDDVFKLVDNGDNTKEVMFEVAQLSSGVTVVLSVPNATTTLVGTDIAQTLTNKTLNAAQNTVTNVDNANIATNAGIDASKLHDGSVSNTEFSYLDGVTGNIQTQLNSKADTTHTHQTITTTTTTTNVAMTIDTLATTTDMTYLLTARVVARRTDVGNESAGFEIKATYRNNSGALTRIGTDDVIAQTDSLSWNVDTNAAASNILLRVHGETGKTIDWKASWSVLTV